jgi:hypothetical protein
MTDYNRSPQINGHPLSKNYTEIKVLENIQFGTGAINTATISDIYDFEKRIIYIDITGVNTGGMSAPMTFAVSSKPVNMTTWTTMHSYSLTNTAYMFALHQSGLALSAVWGAPIANIKIVVTNPNTGTAAAVTACTATVNVGLCLKK